MSADADADDAKRRILAAMEKLDGWSLVLMAEEAEGRVHAQEQQRIADAAWEREEADRREYEAWKARRRR